MAVYLASVLIKILHVESSIEMWLWRNYAVGVSESWASAKVIRNVAPHAAAYIRVSTLEQADSIHSLEAQASKLAAFADLQDYAVACQDVDGSYSSAMRDRPALTQILADAGVGLVITDRVEQALTEQTWRHLP